MLAFLMPEFSCQSVSTAIMGKELAAKSPSPGAAKADPSLARSSCWFLTAEEVPSVPCPLVLQAPLGLGELHSRLGFSSGLASRRTRLQ